MRSTFIVGYPGETEQDFEYLLDWMAEAKIEHAGCFKYEPVAGAYSNALPDQVAEDIKEDRWHRFMQAQAAISAEIKRAKVGRQIDVIIDDIDQENQIAIARSKWDAPEVDGNAFIEGAMHLSVGDMVKVDVIGSQDYDLITKLA